MYIEFSDIFICICAGSYTQIKMQSFPTGSPQGDTVLTSVTTGEFCFIYNTALFWVNGGSISKLKNNTSVNWSYGHGHFLHDPHAFYNDFCIFMLFKMTKISDLGDLLVRRSLRSGNTVHIWICGSGSPCGHGPCINLLLPIFWNAGIFADSRFKG